MLNLKVSLYWRICWSIVTPAILIVVLLYSLITMKPLEYNDVLYPVAGVGKSPFHFINSYFYFIIRRKVKYCIKIQNSRVLHKYIQGRIEWHLREWPFQRWSGDAKVFLAIAFVGRSSMKYCTCQEFAQYLDPKFHHRILGHQHEQYKTCNECDALLLFIRGFSCQSITFLFRETLNFQSPHIYFIDSLRVFRMRINNFECKRKTSCISFSRFMNACDFSRDFPPRHSTFSPRIFAADEQKRVKRSLCYVSLVEQFYISRTMIHPHVFQNMYDKIRKSACVIARIMNGSLLHENIVFHGQLFDLRFINPSMYKKTRIKLPNIMTEDRRASYFIRAQYRN